MGAEFYTLSWSLSPLDSKLDEVSVLACVSSSPGAHATWKGLNETQAM